MGDAQEDRVNNYTFMCAYIRNRIVAQTKQDVIVQHCVDANGDLYFRAVSNSQMAAWKLSSQLLMASRSPDDVLDSVADRIGKMIVMQTCAGLGHPAVRDNGEMFECICGQEKMNWYECQPDFRWDLEPKAGAIQVEPEAKENQ